MKAKPGDVVLYHNPKFNLFTWLIHVTTGSRWNHAAILIDDHTDQGLRVAEATAKGVQISPLSATTDETLVIPVVYDDVEDRLTAIAWARARVGTRYGYFNAFMCGVNNVLVGLGFVIKRTDAVICSELVAECLIRAGDERVIKDASQVSPGDLATLLGVER